MARFMLMATTVASGRMVRPNGASPNRSAWSAMRPSMRRSRHAMRFCFIMKKPSTSTNDEACEMTVASAAPAVPAPSRMTNT